MIDTHQGQRDFHLDREQVIVHGYSGIPRWSTFRIDPTN